MTAPSQLFARFPRMAWTSATMKSAMDAPYQDRDKFDVLTASAISGLSMALKLRIVKRSEVMSRIRGRGNKDTELALAKLFRRHKIADWRRQTTLIVRSSRREEAHTENRKSKIRNPKLIGASSPRLLRVKVDFVFRRERLALFVDGYFWYRFAVSYEGGR